MELKTKLWDNDIDLAINPVEHSMQNQITSEQIEQAIALIEQTGDFRVLKRMSESNKFSEMPENPSELRVGSVVDVETTGLQLTPSPDKPSGDKVVEVGIVSFLYSAKTGKVIEIIDSYNGLQDPGMPISEEASRTSGITDADVAGKSLDHERILAMLAKTDLVIAHNAPFDREMLEKDFPWFPRTMNWSCSVQDIPWRSRGVSSSNLGSLGTYFGFFFDAHRAEIDCRATISVLASEFPDGASVLGVLLENCRRPVRRIFAKDSPFDTKDMLKSNGYQWNDGSNGLPKSWSKDVRSQEEFDKEIRYLREDIYRKDSRSILFATIHPSFRFTTRIPTDAYEQFTDPTPQPPLVQTTTQP